MSALEKSAVGLAAVLMVLFGIDGIDHSATWLVATAAIIVSGTSGAWMITASRWRRRAERAEARR